MKIFETAQPVEDQKNIIKFHVPFLQNMNQKSPMHKCQDIQDIRTINTMLSYLSGYGIDHHSRAIIEILPFIIERDLPSLFDYIDSRLVQTEQVKKITKGILNDERKNTTETQIWFKKSEFDKKLMKKQ